MGDYLARSGYFFAVLEFQDPAPSSSSDSAAKTGTRLVAVHLIVGNQSGKTDLVSDGDVRLKDTEGNLYRNASAAWDIHLPAVFLNPGERVEGWIVFAIPENVQSEAVVCEIGLERGDGVEFGLAVPPEGHSPISVDTARTRPGRSKLGEQGSYDGYSLTAFTVEDPAESAFALVYHPPDGWHLAAVEIEVGNWGRMEEYNNFNYSDISLVDTDGFLHIPEFNGRAGGIEGGDFSLGKKFRGWVSFTIPDGLQLESVKFADSWVYGQVYAGLAE